VNKTVPDRAESRQKRGWGGYRLGLTKVGRSIEMVDLSLGSERVVAFRLNFGGNETA
jgi:hypothetical protein